MSKKIVAIIAFVIVLLGIFYLQFNEIRLQPLKPPAAHEMAER